MAHGSSYHMNWVKATIGLRYLKDGIQPFVCETIDEMHIQFLEAVRLSLNLPPGTVPRCSQCTTANIIPCRPLSGLCKYEGKNKCRYHDRTNLLKRYRPCPNAICDQLSDKIRLQHAARGTVSWRCTCADKWCTNSWEMAKCFMPAEWYSTANTASDTDLPGLLGIILNCRFIHNKVAATLGKGGDIFSRAREVRNAVFHCPSHELTDSKLTHYLGAMIDVLLDSKCLLTHPAAVDAVSNINKIKAGDLLITVIDEQKAKQELDTADERNKQRRAQLQTYLRTMYDRHLGRIPLSLLQPEEIHADIDSVYSELVLQEWTDNLSLKGTSTIDCKAEDGTNIVPHNIQSYRNIFRQIYTNDDEDGDSDTCIKSAVQNVILFGEAGTGKTTWCLKLIRTWVKALQNRSSNFVLTENETSILDFDLVFYVSLREANSRSSIIELICDQLLRDDVDLFEITQETLNFNLAKSLVILDDMDGRCMSRHKLSIDREVLPARDDNSDYTILVTTRPSNLDILKKSQLNECRIVQIKGLMESAIPQLVTHVVNVLNEHTGKSKTFRSFDEPSVMNIKECMEIPFLLTSLTCMWYEQENIIDSMAESCSGLIEILIKYFENMSRNVGNVFAPQTGNPNAKRESCLPECLSKRLTCEIYGHLLFALGQIAFADLFIQKHSVFTRSSIQTILPSNGCEQALGIGILSQTHLPGSVLEKEFIVTFMHTTLQEYFAAVYMVTGDEMHTDKCIAICKSHVESHQDLSHLRNVLLFTSGMSSKSANKLFSHMSHIVHSDADSEAHAQLHRLFIDLLDQQQDSDVYIETHTLYTNEYHKYNDKTVFYINTHTHDPLRPIRLQVKVQGDGDATPLKTALQAVTPEDRHNLSIEMTCRESSCTQIQENIDAVPYINVLHLESVKHDSDEVALCLTVKDSIKKLKILNCDVKLEASLQELNHLEICNMDANSMQTLISPLQQNCSLRSLKLIGNCPQRCTPLEIKLSIADKLEYIELNRIALSTFSPLTACLRKVVLRDIDAKDVSFLFNESLAHSQHLVTVDCSFLNQCHIGEANFARNTQLKVLKLEHCSVDIGQNVRPLETLKLSNALSTLHVCNIDPKHVGTIDVSKKQLKSIKLVNVEASIIGEVPPCLEEVILQLTRDTDSVAYLSSALGNCANLTQVEINGCKRQQLQAIDLTNNLNLRNFKLSNCNVTVDCLAPHSLESVAFTNITSKTALVKFSESLINCPNLTSFTCCDVEPQYIGSIDFSKSKHLRVLCLSGVTADFAGIAPASIVVVQLKDIVADGLPEIFCESLRYCRQLKHIECHTYYHTFIGMVDLRENKSLSRLKLHNVDVEYITCVPECMEDVQLITIRSERPLYELGESFCQCSNLKSVQVSAMQYIEMGILNFSQNTELENLILEKVNISHLGSVCERLEHVTLREISGDACFDDIVASLKHIADRRNEELNKVQCGKIIKFHLHYTCDTILFFNTSV